MATIYGDGKGLKMEKIICRQWGDTPAVVFEATVATRESSVLIKIGDVMALVSREEIAAAAAMWPVCNLALGTRHSAISP